MTDPRTPTSDPVAEAWEAAPQTEAGRRLFTDNEPGDMLESDGVTWGDVVAIEAEARQQARAAFAAPCHCGRPWDDHDVHYPADRDATASPEPASPEAPGSGLSVERLMKAYDATPVDVNEIDGSMMSFWRAVAATYDRLAARPDGAEADAS